MSAISSTITSTTASSSTTTNTSATPMPSRLSTNPPKILLWNPSTQAYPKITNDIPAMLKALCQDKNEGLQMKGNTAWTEEDWVKRVIPASIDPSIGGGLRAIRGDLRGHSLPPFTPATLRVLAALPNLIALDISLAYLPDVTPKQWDELFAESGAHSQLAQLEHLGISGYALEGQKAAKSVGPLNGSHVFFRVLSTIPGSAYSSTGDCKLRSLELAHIRANESMLKVAPFKDLQAHFTRFNQLESLVLDNVRGVDIFFYTQQGNYSPAVQCSLRRSLRRLIFRVTATSPSLDDIKKMNGGEATVGAPTPERLAKFLDESMPNASDQFRIELYLRRTSEENWDQYEYSERLEKRYQENETIQTMIKKGRLHLEMRPLWP